MAGQMQNMGEPLDLVNRGAESAFGIIIFLFDFTGFFWTFFLPAREWEGSGSGSAFR
jgi:hypothetical protein